MKFAYSTLKRFLETDASLEQICKTATMIGLELEGIEDKAEALTPFVVAEIISAEKHPNADKLQVCKVKTATSELQIVCGAPNARAGIKVALANVGVTIPNGNFEIKKAKVRDVESQGMLCSADELGLGGDSAGIIELPLDAPIGASIVDVLGLNDPIIDLNITANRGDCMGVMGIARDIAATGIGKFVTQQPEAFSAGGETYPITIEDTEGCPAFRGRIIRGVKNGQSPAWLQHTLTAAGMRPISVLVDITNYLTLVYGRPAHVYDLKKLKGTLRVRRAVEGETFEALNDKTYRLNTQCCVIADDSGVIGLGGIMGGKSTAVDENTTDVLLEIALFNPLRIAKSGRALQIDSDARSRFERGVPSKGLEPGDIGAASMILALAGGKAEESNFVGALPAHVAPIPFDAKAINALGGTNITEAEMVKILSSLGFEIHGGNVTVPTWRHDVTMLADLAEEVLRIHGYDNIPAVSLPKSTSVSKPAVNQAQQRLSTLRRAAASRGLHETHSWGFISDAQAKAFGGQAEELRLLNPISADLSIMRPNLLPHLIDAVKRNAARGQNSIAIFEAGATFQNITPTGQKNVVAGVRAGLKHGFSHLGSPNADVLDVKGDVFALLEAAGYDASKLTVTRDVPAWYHPGRAGAIAMGKNILATFGELHPATLKALDCDVKVMAFELHVDAIPLPKAAKRKALTVSDFQPVTRDFAFMVDGGVAAADILKAINGADKALIRDTAIFDVYEGNKLPEGKKSIAVSVTLQADDRTLTDAEIEKTSQAIITAAMGIGATLR
ncbi:MAG: phenylalanine--tRNA ligase subunit beta [Alphaproteobacteria bacterium]|nr:phenylalanine--tRNA ligase subunit beta [Alphaproteobacteria bacterium]